MCIFLEIAWVLQFLTEAGLVTSHLTAPFQHNNAIKSSHFNVLTWLTNLSVLTTNVQTHKDGMEKKIV